MKYNKKLKINKPKKDYSKNLFGNKEYDSLIQVEKRLQQWEARISSEDTDIQRIYYDMPGLDPKIK